MDPNRRNLLAIYFLQFGSAFSGNFIKIFMPFFIIKVSPYSMQHTLLWIGAIMGSTSLCAAFTSTFWGSLTHRYSPKMLYLRAFLVNAFTFLLMGFTTDLYLLLLFRVLQGLASGTSTIGLIMVTMSSSEEKVSVDIGFFQSAMTLGQLVGPLIGSLSAGLLGYQGAFISTSVILFLFFFFCYFYVLDVPRLPRRERVFQWRAIDKRILAAWGVCFTVMVQLMFLPSVLPTIFSQFHVEETAALKSAGVVVMIYTSSAMIGTYLWSNLSKTFGMHRMILSLLALGILLQASLVFSTGLVDFTLIRLIQTGLVAAVLPLTISIFATASRGGTIGFINSARFAGNALGPILATSILAYSNLTVLYIVISVLTLLALLGFKAAFK